MCSTNVYIVISGCLNLTNTSVKVTKPSSKPRKPSEYNFFKNNRTELIPYELELFRAQTKGERTTIYSFFWG